MECGQPTLLKRIENVFLTLGNSEGIGRIFIYMKKGFPIYEEMREYLIMYEEADSHI